MNANHFPIFTADQLHKFNTIEPSHFSCAVGKENDFMVGEIRKATLNLPSNTVTYFRDIVILGEVSIAGDSATPEARATIIARDIIVGGKFNMCNLKLVSQSMYVAKNAKDFRDEVARIVPN